MTASSSERALRWFVIGLLTTGALAALVHPINPDEGVFLNGAWNLQHGRVLYVDFFEFVGPVSFHLIDLAWTLLEPTYLVARSLAILCAALASVGVVAISRLIDRDRPAYGAALAYFVFLCAGPLVSHNGFVLAPLVWATYFAIRGSRSSGVAGFLACGLLCGVAALTVQHKGALLAMAIGSVQFARAVSPDTRTLLKRNSVLASGTLLASSALLAWPLAAIYECLIAFPLTRYSSIQHVGSWQFIAAAAFCGWVLAKVRMSMAKGEFLVLATAQVALIASCVPRPDAAHLIPAMFPVFACYPALAAALRPPLGADPTGRKRHPALLRIKVFAFVLLSLVAVQAPMAQRTRVELLEAIGRTCGDRFTLYAGPFSPGLYFETRTLNVTAYSVLFDGYSRDRHFTETLEALRREKPNCAVLDLTLSRKFGHAGANPVETYIRQAYELRTTSRDAEIFVRREPPIADDR